MKRMIVKAVLSRWLLCCLVFGVAGSAPPARAQVDSQDARPVVVLSFSGYAESKRDVEFLGKLSSNPDTAASIEQWLSLVTQGQALAAVDPDRPWGAFLSVTEDSQISGVSFIPISDFRQLVGAFSNVFGEPVDSGHDVYAFKGSNSSYYLAQKGRWAYWTQQKDALETLPTDPQVMLGGLDQQYDLAVRVNVQNVPQGMRELAVAFIRQWLEAKLQQGRDEEDDEPNTSFAGLGRNKVEQLAKCVNDLDRVTVGLSIDGLRNRTDLDVEITALPESTAAKAFAAGAENPKGSRLSGVLLPDAIFSLHVNSLFSGADKEQAGALLPSLFGRVLDQVANGEEVDGIQKAKAKELVGKLLGVLGETLENESHINLGFVVTNAGSADEFGDLINSAVEDAFPNRVHETIIGAGQITAVAGGLTADGAEFEKAAMQLAAVIAKVSGQDQPKLNIDKYEGRRFHAVSVMAPQTMRAEWPLRTFRNLLGNPLKIVMAFGEDTFYVAVGEKGVGAIKQVIDKSMAAPAEKLPAVTASIGLAPIWKLIASENRNRRAAELAESLKAGGKDRITFTVVPVRNGVRYRLEGEDGFNMLLGGSVGSAARVLTASKQ